MGIESFSKKEWIDSKSHYNDWYSELTKTEADSFPLGSWTKPRIVFEVKIFAPPGLKCSLTVFFSDIDECSRIPPEVCVPALSGGVCTDTDGSYRCSCFTGYTGDGLTSCEGRSDLKLNLKERRWDRKEKKHEKENPISPAVAVRIKLRNRVGLGYMQGLNQWPSH